MYVFHSWDTLILYDYSLLALTIVLIFIFIKYCFKTFESRLFFVISIIGLILFEIIFYPAAHVRHRGHHFIAWLVCVYLTREKRGITPEHPYSILIFKSVIIIHCISGIYSYVKDVMYPFSNGKAVASYLSNVKEQKPIILYLKA
jgi:hypothetical protein